jgi:hypothetical protein
MSLFSVDEIRAGLNRRRFLTATLVLLLFFLCAPGLGLANFGAASRVVFLTDSSHISQPNTFFTAVFPTPVEPDCDTLSINGDPDGDDLIVFDNSPASPVPTFTCLHMPQQPRALPAVFFNVLAARSPPVSFGS